MLDEPLSNLDAKLREEMRFEIRDVVTRLGVTAVYVTHDQEEALALSDRIAIMHRGRIEQLGTPEDIYARPASRFVAEFVGLSSFLEGVIEAVATDGMRVPVGGGHVTVPALPGATPGRRALLFVRPNEVELLAGRRAGRGGPPGDGRGRDLPRGPHGLPAPPGRRARRSASSGTAARGSPPAPRCGSSCLPVVSGRCRKGAETEARIEGSAP